MSLRVGVIGAGHLGRFHAKLIGEAGNATLCGVADPVAESCQRVAAECGTRGYADYHDLIPHIDAAIVATPTNFHHSVGMDLLGRGIHVLMEKPLAMNKAEADELVELAGKSGLTLQVGHIERFNPALDRARQFIRDPKYIEASRYSGYTFRSTDIGVVMDLMIHDLDIAMSLIGSTVESVHAVGTSVIGPHEDVAQARLLFANGAVANLSASRCSYQATRKMQVWSRTGHVNIDFATRSAVVAEPCAMLQQGRFSPETVLPIEKSRLKDRVFEELIPLRRFEADAQNALLEEQRDFVSAIVQRRAPQVTGAQGRDVVAVAERIIQSLSAWQATIAASSVPSTDHAALSEAPLSNDPTILRGPHWNRTGHSVAQHGAPQHGMPSLSNIKRPA